MSSILEDAASTQSPATSKPKNRRWWLLLFYTAIMLTGQTVAVLLGRFYFEHGGSSLWMTTLLPTCGSPLIIILLLLRQSTSYRLPSSSVIAATFTFIGLLITGDNLMYSYGLRYLPVSTYSILCATQLAFNAVFAYFINSQKFTPYILNSVILLTLAAVLLGVHSDDGGGSASSDNFPLGLTLTLGASAIFGLILSLSQFALQKVMKAETSSSVLVMVLCTGLVSSLASVVGLFVSGQWRGIHVEFAGFERGQIAYVMTLVSISVGWLMASVGSLGLIFSVSSLFANVIATLGIPLVPIFAVVFFHERMEGVKVVSLLIAVLGFTNYMYQYYLDDSKDKKAWRDRSDMDTMNQ